MTEVEAVKKEISRIVREHLPSREYRAFFFGSRAEGKHRERSDIDVGIMGQKPLSLDKLFEIKEALDKIPTLFKIDVVDFRQTSKDFREVALAHTEEIL